jgi:hypothetical protein
MPIGDWPNLSELLGDTTAATCEHQCRCAHHQDNSKAVHVMPCCRGCGKGHHQINPLRLEAHLRQCHADGK